MSSSQGLGWGGVPGLWPRQVWASKGSCGEGAKGPQGVLGTLASLRQLAPSTHPAPRCGAADAALPCTVAGSGPRTLWGSPLPRGIWQLIGHVGTCLKPRPFPLGISSSLPGAPG